MNNKLNVYSTYPLSSYSLFKYIKNILIILTLMDKYIKVYDTHYIPMIPFRLYYGVIKINFSSDQINYSKEFYDFKIYNFFDFLTDLKLEITDPKLYKNIENKLLNYKINNNYEFDIDRDYMNIILNELSFNNKIEFSKALKIFNKHFLKNDLFNNNLLTSYKYEKWYGLLDMSLVMKKGYWDEKNK